MNRSQGEKVKAAVKALNVVEQRRLVTTLGDKDLPAHVYGNLKREELLRTGSVVLHEVVLRKTIAVSGGNSLTTFSISASITAVGSGLGMTRASSNSKKSLIARLS
jgi:hypothetical protein